MTKLAPLLLVVALAFLVSGCASSHRTSVARPPATSRSRSAGPQRVRLAPMPPHTRLNGHGAGFLSPTRLGFYTSGSSDCMPTPTTLAVVNRHAIRVKLEDRFHGACLTDLIIAPVVIAIDPRQVDVHRPLTVRLLYPRAKHAEVVTAAPLS